jgi:FtsZ-binding cell division protein ZapB
MKAYIIQSGHFSQAGNFIGFSALGERVHIYKKQINRLFPNRQVKFPFYCLAENKTFNSIYGTTFNRLTAEEISLEKYEIVFYSTLRDRSLEEIIDFKANNLQQEHDKLKAAHDKLQKEYDFLVAKVEHFDAEGEIGDYIRIADNLKDQVNELQQENERLKDDFNASQWDNEYIQSERERLALIIINARETLMSCDLGLSQDKINQLINNA